jgi:hypothetical protein
MSSPGRDPGERRSRTTSGWRSPRLPEPATDPFRTGHRRTPPERCDSRHHRLRGDGTTGPRSSRAALSILGTCLPDAPGPADSCSRPSSRWSLPPRSRGSRSPGPSRPRHRQSPQRPRPLSHRRRVRPPWRAAPRVPPRTTSSVALAMPCRAPVGRRWLAINSRHPRRPARPSRFELPSRRPNRRAADRADRVRGTTGSITSGSRRSGSPRRSSRSPAPGAGRPTRACIAGAAQAGTTCNCWATPGARSSRCTTRMSALGCTRA